MSARPTATEQLDMDSLFDFSQGTSQPSPAIALSPYGKEERPQFAAPSHDYAQFKQQVGVPLAGMSAGFHVPSDMDYNAGYGFNSGLDFDHDMTMDFSAPPTAPMFFEQPAEFAPTVNPTTLGGEEPASHVGRLWPGMHSQQAQQAALAKAAQTQAAQQRQIKLQAQQRALAAQAPAATASKRASHPVEPHVEESISRLLHQMRQNGGVSADDDDSHDGMPHAGRLKKDEEDMDEDERLLASEEGKKLSSKERRQLRNKVSARAFRSRRKEYIGQLESEIALRSQENNALRAENQSVMQENERYRGLIETLLRHPAFTPFINDISNDPSLLGVPQQHLKQHAPQPTPSAPAQAPAQPQPVAPAKPDFLNFDASQLQIPTPQPGDGAPRVHLATLPENDFSKLNLNGFQSGAYANAYSVGAYAVTELPAEPCPLSLLAEIPALPDSLVDLDRDAAAIDPTDLSLLLTKLGRAAVSLDGAC